MRAPLEDGHGREVEGEPGGRLERPDAPLAQDHVAVAHAQDVLGGAEPLVDRAAEAALQQHRHAGAPDLGQQREVLRVAGTDLQDVDVLGHVRDVARVDDLRHHRKSGRAGHPGQVPDTFAAAALERVR